MAITNTSVLSDTIQTVISEADTPNKSKKSSVESAGE